MAELNWFYWPTLPISVKWCGICKCFPYVRNMPTITYNDEQFSTESLSWGFMSYLRYVCLFAYSGIQHILLCCGFVLFVIVLCAQCCQRLWMVHSSLLLRFSLTFMYQPLPRMKFTFHNSYVTLEFEDCVQTIYSVTIFLNTEPLSLNKRIILSFTIPRLYWK